MEGDFVHTALTSQFRAKQQMQRRKFILSLVGGTALGWTGWKNKSFWSVHSNASRSAGPLIQVSRSTHALGTHVKLTVFHADADHALLAINRAFKEIDLVERLMSLYRPYSQLSVLNRRGFLKEPHPRLVEILNLARDLSRNTAGAFDFTVQPLYALHAAAAECGTVPDEKEIARVLKVVGWSRVEVAPGRIRLENTGMAITLNGIAQGYASDVIGHVLREEGIEHALIDSGEIGTIGNHAENRDWQIGIKHPRKPEALLGLTHLDGRCLATSGDYETRFGDSFERHHLLNPHTGLSANDLSSVSVLAANATQADALSTALFILGLRDGRALIEDTPRADALFVDKQGIVTRTRGFPITT